MTREEILGNRIVVHGLTGKATLRVTWCAKTIDHALQDLRDAFGTVYGVKLECLKLVNTSPSYEQDKNGEPFSDYTVDVEIEIENPSICIRTGAIQTALEVYHRYLYEDK